MLPPVFWKPEQATLEGNAGLWLSRSAYDELLSRGATEWRLGFGDAALGAAAKALKTMQTVSTLLAGASGTPGAAIEPFRLELKSAATILPVRLDGRLEAVQVLLARNWFAEYVILKNPENPLILKVSVNPLAVEALKAFEPLKIDTATLGYEITSLSRP